MEPMKLSEIMEAVGGVPLGSCDLDMLIREVGTDSRTIKKNTLFVPLSGEQFDGHEYIGDALLGGAVACFTGKVPETLLEGKAYIQVSDPLKALGALAKYYKSKYPVPVVAVTGSVGKTTTKDMLASVLSEKYEVLKTEGNYNNEVGLPLTLLRLSPKYELAVLELGMNHSGEIDYLSSLTEPDMVAITNIGDAHMENLGSREGILAAKCEIFNHAKPDAIALLNGDDALLRTLEGKPGIIWCGEGAHCRLQAQEIELVSGSHIHCVASSPKQRYTLDIPAIGKHMIYPTLFAIAAGEHFGLSAEQIQTGIARFAPTKMRMNILRRRNNITILDDAYNANPQSMRAAVEALDTMPEGFKIAILGDMFELGPLAPTLHRGVGEYLARTHVNALVAIGENARQIYDAAVEGGIGSARHFEDKAEALKEIGALLRPDAVVLVKASRGMHFEVITEHLKELTEAQD